MAEGLRTTLYFLGNPEDYDTKYTIFDLENFGEFVQTFTVDAKKKRNVRIWFLYERFIKQIIYENFL